MARRLALMVYTIWPAACRLEENTLRPAGYGILKDGRCVGWIALPEAQGVKRAIEFGKKQNAVSEQARKAMEAYLR